MTKTIQQGTGTGYYEIPILTPPTKHMHLPVTHGIDIYVEFTPLKTVEVRCVYAGFPQEMAHNTIQTGLRDFGVATRVAEGYFNGKLDVEEKRELNVDTTKSGWLERFVVEGDSKC